MIRTPKSRAEAEYLDQVDPLAGAREAFLLPAGLIYLDGHSLGPATHAALKTLERTAQSEWAQGLIRSWNTAGWIDLPQTVGASIARLLGAQPSEVIVCDSVSVNLFKLAAAALPLAEKPLILIENDDFPTDQYVAAGLSDLLGARLLRIDPSESLATLANTGGVLIKSAVHYRSARCADIAAYETAARGGVIVWDLSHAVGVLDLDLTRLGVRLAAGCTYKYLNGGPGAPAFIYVRNDLADRIRSPIAGWMGHAAPFAFDDVYRPRAQAARFAAGTPGILSLAALAGAVSIYDGLRLADLAAKSRALGDMCLDRARSLGLQLLSPDSASDRGGHVSLRHQDGYAVVQALAARGVIADFRAPDAMRFGFSPLILRYVEVWDAMAALAEVLTTRAFDAPAFRRQAAVT